MWKSTHFFFPWILFSLCRQKQQQRAWKRIYHFFMWGKLLNVCLALWKIISLLDLFFALCHILFHFQKIFINDFLGRKRIYDLIRFIAFSHYIHLTSTRANFTEGTRNINKSKFKIATKMLLTSSLILWGKCKAIIIEGSLDYPTLWVMAFTLIYIFFLCGGGVIWSFNIKLMKSIFEKSKWKLLLAFLNWIWQKNNKIVNFIGF